MCKVLACIVATALTVSGASTTVEFVGKTKYLNNARAVVTHSIDDSTKYVPKALDALDKYGIKTTAFVSTDADPAPEERFFNQLLIQELWPRLEKAIADGHEIGSHAQTHPCKNPDTEQFCSAAYTDAEVAGSRDEILKHTQQRYVWTWCYPCGHCANYPFIQKRIKDAGYLVARNYPDESHDGHIVPNLQTWAENPYNAGYTQVVQKRGGSAKTERLDLDVLNGKFDEIYEKGGIYSFMSHPQWLNYGPDAFFEKHLAHIGRRSDVWYVPMGPLYAYKTIHDETAVRPLKSSHSNPQFTVANNLDPKIYNGSLTLEFLASEAVEVYSNGKALTERKSGMTDRWNEEYFRREGDKVYVTVLPHTTLEFRNAAGGAGTGLLADLSGQWSASFVSEEGQYKQSILTLTIEDGKVSGAFASARGKAAIGGGTVEGNQIKFYVVRKSNYDETKIDFTGTLKGDVLNLKMQFGDRAPVSMTAKRAERAVASSAVAFATQYRAASVPEDGVDIVQLTDEAHHTSVSVAPSIGNIAFRMLVNGQNILYFPFDSVRAFHDKPRICGIPLLAPWADRLDETAFYANGKRYAFNLGLQNLHLDSNGLPIHGFLSLTSDWQVVKMRADRREAQLTSRLDVSRRPEWMAQFPFAHSIEMTYTLHDGALEVRTLVTNQSAEPMPLSIGYHSFYQITDAPRKDWTVSLGAAREWPVNKELVPTGETRPLNELVDHPDAFALGERSFDNVLGDLIRDAEGLAKFSISGKRQKIEVFYGPKFRAGEIYAPPKMSFLCFEPMVGIDNALNLAHRGVYKELTTIAPGGNWAESFWIRPSGFGE